MTQEEIRELIEIEREAEKRMETIRHERQDRIRREPEELREELEWQWKPDHRDNGRN